MGKETRKQFIYEKRVIYEWDQSLDTLYVYIEVPPLPPNVKLSAVFDIKITPKTLSVGFKNTKPYLQHELQGIADSEQSLWYIQQAKDSKGNDIKQIVIELQKAQKGVRWSAAFKGHTTLNPIQEEELKKKILLQRFQQQNPSFDFSDAQFNGNIPQARTFMGGVKYD